MVVPFQDEPSGKKEQVARMFDNISQRYDRLNHILSLGIDRGWRKKAIQVLEQHKPERILDVATGTGDFAIEASRIPGSQITGVDISEGMLEAGRSKIASLGLTERVRLVTGDSEKLDFEDNFFDAVIVAFGVRNFEHLDQGILEIRRVLRPGGLLVVLELSEPENRLTGILYRLYFHRILPVLGQLISGDRHAYRYLPNSVSAFPNGRLFLQVLQRCGLNSATWKPLTLGTCGLYTAVK